MASTFNYATVTDLENLLLIDVASTFESQVEEWITAAERQVNQYLGYTTTSGLWNESVVDEISKAKVDSGLNLVVHPRKRPINSVSAIDLIKGGDAITLTLTNSDGTTKYNLPTKGGEIVFPNFEIDTSGSTVLNSFADIKYSDYYTRIDYLGGYTAIPEDITVATTLWASDIFMRQSNKENLRSITQGRLTKRWSELKDGESDFIKQSKALLNPYRIASNWV